MDTDDLFAVAKILAELNRLRFSFKLIIYGVEFRNTTDNNFSIYHWRSVLIKGLKKKLLEEANNRIRYELILTAADGVHKKYCKASWDESIRRYKFSMQIGTVTDSKTFYSLKDEEAHREIIKLIGSY
ncbi:MAG: hypothetical protein Q4A33_02615 [Candidatus Saccharibacteria bacterium]|nr:hypothetical protein [Candidatus Saccharibacteria bacterium]